MAGLSDVTSDHPANGNKPATSLLVNDPENGRYLSNNWLLLFDWLLLTNLDEITLAFFLVLEVIGKFV